jgi:hypothetical protein
VSIFICFEYTEGWRGSQDLEARNVNQARKNVRADYLLDPPCIDHVLEKLHVQRNFGRHVENILVKETATDSLRTLKGVC